jgi:hypothetical protein
VTDGRRKPVRDFSHAARYMVKMKTKVVVLVVFAGVVGVFAGV